MGMGTVTVVLLVTALLTSMLSAIIGMGGGILLLAVILGFVPHGVAIPLHAVVQLVSNSTRLLAFIRSADRKVVIAFTIGAIPGAVIGGLALWLIGRLDASEPYLKCAIGAYVLAAAFIPAPTRQRSAHSHMRGFAFIGLLTGALSLTVGAVGPLIAPIFARYDFVKQRLIATKAACQMITHVLKIPAFAILGSIHWGTMGPLAGGMILMVIPGTLIGKRLLNFVSPAAFRILYRAALLVSGAKVLIFDGLATLIRS